MPDLSPSGYALIFCLVWAVVAVIWFLQSERVTQWARDWRADREARAIATRTRRRLNAESQSR